jgi:hypothetical protein
MTSALFSPAMFAFLGGQDHECDPSTLALTLWTRANYTGTPWVGEISAGASSSFSWSAVNAPSVGSSLNGFTPGDFDGSNDRMFNDSIALSSILSASTWWIGILARIDTTIAAVESNWYDNDEPIIADNQGGWGIGVSSSGVRAASYDSGNFRTTADSGAGGAWVPFATGAWGWVEAWLSGGTLSCSLNGGTAASVACGNSSILGSSLPRLGANYSTAKFFDGQVADVMAMASVPSAEIRACIKDNYLFERYGLTL